MGNLFSNKLTAFKEKQLSKSQLRITNGGLDITDPNNDEDQGKRKKRKDEATS